MAKVTKRAISNGKRNTPIITAEIFKRGNTLELKWKEGDTTLRGTKNVLEIEPTEFDLLAKRMFQTNPDIAIRAFGLALASS